MFYNIVTSMSLNKWIYLSNNLSRFSSQVYFVGNEHISYRLILRFNKLNDAEAQIKMTQKIHETSACILNTEGSDYVHTIFSWPLPF